MSVTGGGIEFRSDDGPGIWPSGEASESNSPQARQVPIPLLGFARRRATRGAKKYRRGKGSGVRGDEMDIEWTAVGAVLLAGALLVGFPIGIAVGYAWRDHISRMRRIRFIAEQERRRTELDGATTAFARPDVLPVREIATARSSLSTRVRETGVSKVTISQARKKAAGPNDPTAKRTDKGSKRRNVPTKSKLKVMTGDVLQEPVSNGTSMEQQP